MLLCVLKRHCLRLVIKLVKNVLVSYPLSRERERESKLSSHLVGIVHFIFLKEAQQLFAVLPILGMFQ